MTLLDKAQQKWYCYKDDEIWFSKEQRWHKRGGLTSQQPQTPSEQRQITAVRSTSEPFVKSAMSTIELKETTLSSYHPSHFFTLGRICGLIGFGLLLIGLSLPTNAGTMSYYGPPMGEMGYSTQHTYYFVKQLFYRSLTENGITTTKFELIPSDIFGTLVILAAFGLLLSKHKKAYATVALLYFVAGFVEIATWPRTESITVGYSCSGEYECLAHQYSHPITGLVTWQLLPGYWIQFLAVTTIAVSAVFRLIDSSAVVKSSLETVSSHPESALVIPIATESAPSLIHSRPTKFCRYCGAKIPRTSIYCEECGRNVQPI